MIYRCRKLHYEPTFARFISLPQWYEVVTTKDRGTASERKLVGYLVKQGFKPTAIYHDLYVRNAYGQSTQIDIVVATDAGLIVIEVKDLGGWIFGRGYDERWTQVMAYGREKYRFYNPFKQNKTHINYLRKSSPIFRDVPMFSLVVFSNRSVLKEITYIPKDALVAKLRRAVQAINDIVKLNPTFYYSDKWAIANTLASYTKHGKEKNAIHVKELNDRLGYERCYD